MRAATSPTDSKSGRRTACADRIITHPKSWSSRNANSAPAPNAHNPATRRGFALDLKLA
ncbi:Uncharacterised protein [Bordetella pertussis]|nr:Uncharacterised protein [Bordetella pertussis]CFW43089.1 Uncharacterised protein [Bordetella pertussis]